MIINIIKNQYLFKKRFFSRLSQCRTIPAIHLTCRDFKYPLSELYTKFMNVSTMQIRIFLNSRVTLLQNKQILKLLFGRLKVLAF